MNFEIRKENKIIKSGAAHVGKRKKSQQTYKNHKQTKNAEEGSKSHNDLNIRFLL